MAPSRSGRVAASSAVYTASPAPSEPAVADRRGDGGTYAAGAGSAEPRLPYDTRRLSAYGGVGAGAPAWRGLVRAAAAARAAAARAIASALVPGGETLALPCARALAGRGRRDALRCRCSCCCFCASIARSRAASSAGSAASAASAAAPSCASASSASNESASAEPVAASAASDACRLAIWMLPLPSVSSTAMSESASACASERVGEQIARVSELRCTIAVKRIAPSPTTG